MWTPLVTAAVMLAGAQSSALLPPDCVRAVPAGTHNGHMVITAGHKPGLWLASARGKVERRLTRGHDGEASGKGADPVSSLAWNLAAEAVGIRQEHGGRSKAAADPLAMLRETGALFGSLQAEPFETVAAILNDSALKDVDAKHKAKLAELIQAFTGSVSDAAKRRGR